jgi:hypothetical protein
MTDKPSDPKSKPKMDQQLADPLNARLAEIAADLEKLELLVAELQHDHNQEKERSQALHDALRRRGEQV